ncbi:MAG: hypothetical protein U5K33_09060 [Halofilum sp. (in: g-proteobacteria)]|nr:hypothetical protein [Halofilum sp. (in: g-proteobacteria)]
MLRNKPSITISLLAGLLIGGGNTARADQAWELDAAEWARPRSGATLVGMAPLPSVVRAWSSADDKDIAILHAGGEEGELWARELRDWLIALGVPGNRVRLVIGGSAPASLELELRPQ